MKKGRDGAYMLTFSACRAFLRIDVTGIQFPQTVFNYFTSEAVSDREKRIWDLK